MATISEPAAQPPPSRDAALQRIEGFATLEPDWDSFGGEPSSPVARGEAWRWIEVVADLFGPRVGAAAWPYSVAPLADGGVQIEWRGSWGIVELEVGPAGELGYLYVADGVTGAQAEEADDVSWSDVLRTLHRALVPSIEAPAMEELADEDELYRRLAPHHLRDDGTVNSSAFKRGKGTTRASRSTSSG